MNNILEHLREILLIKGKLLNVTIGDLQTDKDSCIALFQLTGNRQGYFGGAKLDDQIIRLVIRDMNFSNGLKTIEKIKATLKNYKDDIILSTNVKTLDTYLGKDDKRRNVWEITYLIRY